ncbi:hypothetical protein L1987_74840 [Smallanthus sonchifolius]|uniref:Uncharacterized protein n=1 Tax=Smallanthus sonchifolius TaxID=185202 RepID=A0ACB9A3W5_9ASTR|nr:hypothetical protein L1987_74840 [Smallanthus sonchifolius]
MLSCKGRVNRVHSFAKKPKILGFESGVTNGCRNAHSDFCRTLCFRRNRRNIPTGKILKFHKWALLSRSGHQKRRLLLKLESPSMAQENGAQFSKTQSLDLSCVYVPMSTLRISGEICTRCLVDVDPVKGVDLESQKHS